ncbi:MAG: PRTRC system ThiF family protein [Pyrinomonadaceae bacterium]
MANKKEPIAPPLNLDFGYMNAATVLTRQPDEHETTTIALVGCGGTGSYMAQHISRIMRVMLEQGRRVRALFIDPDRVEEKNIGRQLFCDAEIGMNKAETLALRYGATWGLDIAAHAKRFEPEMVKAYGGSPLTVIVGCVDNAAARKSIAASLNNRPGSAPRIWWLDCGNHEEAGQVLLGAAPKIEHVKEWFTSASICKSLPSPALQCPELLQAKPEETNVSKLSCAELTLLNVQSLQINNRVAAEAADMLTRLLVTRNLKRFACEINMAAGSMKSTYVTPESIAAIQKGKRINEHR